MKTSAFPDNGDHELALIVTRITELCADIREVVLQPADSAALPPFTAGAHIRVTLPDGRTNAYSLIDLDHRCDAPSEYTLAIRRDDTGAGGSKWMHGLSVGDRITAHGPQNDFPLETGSSQALLLAGGIGITPLLSMATALAGSARDWHMHYAARSTDIAAYADRLIETHRDRIRLHLDDQAGGPLAVAELIAGAAPETHIYVCGPRPMIDAVRQAAESAGFPSDQVHSELFDAPAPQADDGSFEVELASSGQVFSIPPDRTIIDVLEENGIDIVYDCQRGDCGICQTTVLEGIPDHRDVVLSQAERDAGDVMQICVSRAKSPRLKLDL